MKRYLNDPELARLVAELNETPVGASEEIREDDPEASARLRALMNEALRHGASDLLLVPGAPPVLRIAGELRKLEGDVLGARDVESMFSAALDAGARKALAAGIPLDFSMTEGESAGARFRVNLHRQKGAVAATLRTIQAKVPSLKSLNLPAELARVVEPVRGLVLVCGPTGSGKSSTIAALIDGINRARHCHIVTIEDPIEYDHTHDKSLIEQVELGRDVASFELGLRAALRQDPDVILVGEIRDASTAAIALSAAETGHLILATLHTNDAAQTIHRLVDLFPPSQHAQIYQQLSFSLHAIVCQQLVASNGSLFPAVELMLMNGAVRNHIRSGKLQHLYNEIVLGKNIGMITFERSLAQLVRDGKLDAAEARRRATHVDELDSLLRG